MKVISLLHLLGAAQGLFLTLTMLFWQRGNRRANVVVAAIFFMMAVALWNSYLITSGLYTTLTFSIRWYDVMRLLTGPLVYLYVREMVAKPLVAKDILHCFPAFVYGIGLVPFFFGPIEEKIQFIEQTLAGASPEYMWFSAVRPVYNLAYLLLALRLLQDYSRRIREVFASLESVSLQWLWYIVLGTTLLIALTAFANIAALWGLIRPTQINLSLAVLAFLWVYGLTFFALRANLIHSDELRVLLADLSQVTVPSSASQRSAIERTLSNRYSSGHLIFLPFKQSEITLENNNEGAAFVSFSEQIPMQINGDQNNETNKSERSAPVNRKGIPMTEFHATEIRRCMEEQKPFLDNQLTVQKFAQISGISTHRVSEILNKELGINFFDFVNFYRVEEWKRRINDAPPSTTIQEIAYSVGFNSKSSFYTAFKKFTGQTPSEYRGQ